MVTRSRGQETPQDHTNDLLQVNMDEKMNAIGNDNNGFLNLVPALDDRMFPTTGVDVIAKDQYDTKMRK